MRWWLSADCSRARAFVAARNSRSGAPSNLEPMSSRSFLMFLRVKAKGAILWAGRRAIGQLRSPPFDRDDPHREVERAPIERLRELGDGDQVVAQPRVLDRAARLVRRAETAEPRPVQVLFERLGLIEHAAPPGQSAVELDVAIEGLGVRARADQHVRPADE